MAIRLIVTITAAPGKGAELAEAYKSLRYVKYSRTWLSGF
jgi:hypothetical protein